MTRFKNNHYPPCSVVEGGQQTAQFNTKLLSYHTWSSIIVMSRVLKFPSKQVVLFFCHSVQFAAPRKKRRTNVIPERPCKPYLSVEWFDITGLLYLAATACTALGFSRKLGRCRVFMVGRWGSCTPRVCSI